MVNSKIIDGRKIAKNILLTVKEEVEKLSAKNIIPGLAVIMVGDDPMSQLYVSRKQKAAADVGINSFVHNMATNTTTKQLRSKIQELNNTPQVHGILVQLPLPDHIDTIEIINSINSKKDVDGFTVENIGKLITEQDGIFPCTPQGCLHLIKSVEPDIKGLNAVVVGRSNIVGRPMSNILMNENCTVTVIHLHTKNPIEIAKNADILVSATGHAGLITEKWVNKNMIVIDVGISRINVDGKEKLVGDVNFNQVKDKVRAITPVPGGVGPMTIAYLMKNTLKAVSLQHY
jgi:methylenetetrahydrofolate dehydrogenase (NADP+) / methenyltetrahydrofolate cyclohydrolase